LSEKVAGLPTSGVLVVLAKDVGCKKGVEDALVTLYDPASSPLSGYNALLMPFKKWKVTQDGHGSIPTFYLNGM
jgi:hypothetical protein